jgi:SAM-dependent methyltransferase
MPDSRSSLTPCPICLETACDVLARKDAKTGQPLLTVVCARCGVGRIDPLPSEESLSEWYKNQYRQEYKQATSPSPRHILRAAKMAKSRWLWLAQHIELSRDARTLDIGASSGEFTYLMKWLGFDAMGLEPHLGYGEYARSTLGLNIAAGTLQESMSRLPAASLDLISMFHVFEHVADPLRILALVRELLRSGGYYFIEVPDATAPCAPHTMFFKAHTLYFSRTSLLQTLVFAGFDVVADGLRDDGSLFVIARKGDATPASDFARHAWNHPADLAKAQAGRRWMPYLADQAVHLRPIRKLGRKWAEYKEASSYADGKAILDGVYAGVQPKPVSPNAATK